MRLPSLRLLQIALLLAALLPASAPIRAQGFQLNRYEPTASGEWFFAVDHPFYSRTRYIAAGFTLNYAHRPFVVGLSTDGQDLSSTRPLIAHQVLGHFDFSGSFKNRVTLSASLPVLFTERGAALAGVEPAERGSVSDPRIGGVVRIYGEPTQDRASIHLAMSLWIPLRAMTDSLPQQVSDTGVRVMPRVILSGLLRSFRWSASAG